MKGIDKIYHFVAGILIALTFTLIFSPLIGIITASVSGVIKDVVYDLKMGKGAFEILDIFATVLGAVVGTVLGLLTINYIFPIL